MRRAVFNVKVEYKVDDVVEVSDLDDIFLSDIKKYIPSHAILIGVIAKNVTGKRHEPGR